MLQKVKELDQQRRQFRKEWIKSERLRYKKAVAELEDQLTLAVQDAYDQGETKAAIARALSTSDRSRVYKMLDSVTDAGVVRLTGDNTASIAGHTFTRLDGVWQPDDVNPDSMRLLEKLL